MADAYLQVELIEHDRLGDEPAKVLAIYTTHVDGIAHLIHQLKREHPDLHGTHACRVTAAADRDGAELHLRNAGLPVTD